MEKTLNKILDEMLNIDQQKLVSALMFFENSIFYLKEKDGTKLIQEVEAEDIEQAFAGVSFSSGILDLNTLYFAKTNGNEEIIVYYPACIKTIVFDKGKAIKIPLPAHVFYGCGQEYKIFAVKDIESEELYAMPLPNIHNGGNICHGSASFPNCSKENIKRAYDVFFNSAFNNDLSDNKIKGKDIKLKKFLYSINGAKKFPEKMLVRMNFELKDLIKKTIRNTED